MSPEQVKGEQDLDHRSDLYSLGMTIYEMLAGRVPLDKSRGEFAVLKSIVEETPPPPVHYVPAIPEALNRVVMKALEKDPTRRYQSAREIIADIEAFETIPLQDPKGNAPDPIVAVGKPEKKVNRRTSRYPGPQVKAPLLFGAAAIIIVLAAVIFLLVRTWQADRLPSLLTVTSSPAGATVYLGDRVIGETPIRDHAVAAGLFHVRLQKSGFTPVDTTLVSETGRPLTISLELTSEAIDAGTAVGTITSIPDDAAVWINERPVGRTPYSLEEAAPDTLMIEVRKEGFRDWQQERNISPGESFTIAASLVPAQERQSGDSDARDDSGDSGASGQRSGTLVVRADPGGHVEVDDEAVGPGGALNLAAGEHKITCGQAPRHFEETVLVSPGQTREVTCYFRSTINIVSTMDDGSFPWASVWINGVYHDQTPTELRLDPGTYHIEVRRDGYRILDDEVVLDLTPALEPQTYPLVFRMTGE
jgi:hypothetical protein